MRPPSLKYGQFGVVSISQDRLQDVEAGFGETDSEMFERQVPEQRVKKQAGSDLFIGRLSPVPSQWQPQSVSPASNQIEIWFSILAGQSLARTSFLSVAQLRAHIDAFVETYNTHAKPFAWTKSEVYQKRLKARFAHQ